MTKRHLLAVVAAATCLAPPAFAQDVADSDTAAPAANDDWTGFYAGVRAGLTNNLDDEGEGIAFDTNLDETFGDTVRTGAGANAFSTGFCSGRALSPRAGDGCDDDDAKTEVAGFVGFDYDFGSFVVGAVGEYAFSTYRDRATAFSTTPANYVFSRRMRDMGAVRARVGFDLDGTLLYGTGGGVYGEVRNRFRSSNVANAFSGSGNDSEFGYQLGGGVERKVGNFSFGAQYLYTKIDFDPFIVRASRGNAPATNPFILVNPNGTDFLRGRRVELHNISVTAAFRF